MRIFPQLQHPHSPNQPIPNSIFAAQNRCNPKNTHPFDLIFQLALAFKHVFTNPTTFFSNKRAILINLPAQVTIGVTVLLNRKEQKLLLRQTPYLIEQQGDDSIV